MRRRKRDLGRRVNGQLALQFQDERLTSFAGLELFARHLRSMAFNETVRKAFRVTPLGGDFSVVVMVRLFMAMLWIGASRLRHVRFVCKDPMLARFVGLSLFPDQRTLSRWLGRFNRDSLQALAAVNAEVVFRAVRKLRLRTLTIDLDGTVLSTGMQVAWAQRGYNPHHRKVPSYYPVLAHLAQTSQILAVKNRPGNVNDGKASIQFLASIIRLLRSRLGRHVRLQFRMDGAFFVRGILEVLLARKVEFALKVPMHSWLGLKPRIQMRTRWVPVTDDVSGFETELAIKQWGMTLRLVCYRKRVFHETAKNFQLDLFSPDDGTYEYSAVATNMALDPVALWHFMAGRGAQEKTIAELKNGLAFDTIPTRRYAANSAWQWLSVLAHNLHRDFQISRQGQKQRRSRKKTFVLRFESIRTDRFEWLNVAGRLLRLAEGLTLRLPDNRALEERYGAWANSA